MESFGKNLSETISRLKRRREKTGFIALRKKPRISFELFPSKTTAGTHKLSRVVNELETLNPDFFSMTYGAGGTDQGRSFRTLHWLGQRTGIPLTEHLTCINAQFAGNGHPLVKGCNAEWPYLGSSLRAGR